jgi:hypothetical protein
MKSRYFVAASIPPKTDYELRDFYRKNFFSEVVIKNIHMSLSTTFFIKDEGQETEIIRRIAEIKFLAFSVKLTNWGIFEQKGKKVLYMKAEPQNLCRELSETVNKTLGDLVETDTSSFDNGTVPVFEAHVSLDYDFKGMLPNDMPLMSFMVEKLVVFREENGAWVVSGP